MKEIDLFDVRDDFRKNNLIAQIMNLNKEHSLKVDYLSYQYHIT